MSNCSTEPNGEAVGVPSGDHGLIPVAGAVAGQQRRGEVVPGLGHEAGRAGPVGLLGGGREVADGGVEAPERGRPPPDRQVDRAEVGDALAAGVLATERP